MKIGIDASKANIQNKTGTEWYSYHLIKNIAQIDQVNDYILYLRDKPQDWIRKLPKNFKYRILKWPPKFLWYQIRLSLEMLFSPPEILFVPAHTIPFIHPRRTVTTCHDVGFERFPELYSLKKIGPKSIILTSLVNLIIRILSLGKFGNNELDYHRFSMNIAARKAEKIIVPSEFTKSEIIRFYHCNPKRITVIPHGYDKSVYNQTRNRSEIYAIGRFRIEKPYILYVGRLEKKKNILGLIEAFGILKNKYKIKHKLVLVGNPGFGYSEAQKRIDQLDVEKDIIQTGWVDTKYLSDIIKASDLFIFPSFYEGFGLPLIEVQACGIPIVASRIPCISEVARDSVIYFDPAKPGQIANSVFNVINNTNLKDSMIRKGIENVKLFDWKMTALKTIQIFNSLNGLP